MIELHKEKFKKYIYLSVTHWQTRPLHLFNNIANICRILEPSTPPTSD